MDNFEVKLNILLDIIKLKSQKLAQILAITENQENVLTAAGDESMGLIFNEMSNEKQILIDDVIKMDKIFQSTFNDFGSEFESAAPDFKDIIGEIQQYIKTVTHLDTEIRIQENKNKDIIAGSQKEKWIEKPKVTKEYMLEQYKKNKTE